MMLWQGYEVLEIDPDRVGPIADAIDRSMVVLDTETGLRAQDVPSLAPAPVRPFTWTAIGRAEIADLMAFRDARLGRLVPFWLPSWQADLHLASAALAGATTLSVRRVRYGELVFSSRARRQIAIYSPGAPLSYHGITHVADPGEGATEIITISPATATALDPARAWIAFLRLCRLEEDELETQYLSLQFARAEIRVREVPNEAP